MTTNPPAGPRSVGVRLITSTCTHGFELDSRYVEEFWTPIAGPTAILLLRTISRIPLQLDNPTPAAIDLELLAEMLGLRFNGGKNSTIVRTIHRLARFDLAINEGTDTDFNIAVPNRIRPVETHRQNHWSQILVAGHDIALSLHHQQLAQRAGATS